MEHPCRERSTAPGSRGSVLYTPPAGAWQCACWFWACTVKASAVRNRQELKPSTADFHNNSLYSCHQSEEHLADRWPRCEHIVEPHILIILIFTVKPSDPRLMRVTGSTRPEKGRRVWFDGVLCGVTVSCVSVCVVCAGMRWS